MPRPVLDATARCQLVLGDGGGVVRRTPPALELTRIGPQLPHPLGRRIELGLDGHREPVRILADGGDGHWSCSLVSAMRSAMRAMRPRHSFSYSSIRWRTTRRLSRLVRASLRRPTRSFVTRPARSRIAMCFWTAAKLIG